jgi:lipopolysaccharide heptosyltransferase II
MRHTPRQRLRLSLLRTFARLARPGSAQLASLDAVGGDLPRAPRILVIRPDHLGDQLFTTPALRVLREQAPDARITALIGPWGVPALRHYPHVSEILTLPFPGFTKKAKPSPWQPYTLLHRWAKRLRGRYDLAVVLRFDHWWGALLAYLARIPLRVGYTVPEVAPFLSHAAPYIARRHQVIQNLKLLDWDEVSSHPSGNIHDEATPLDCPLEFHTPEKAAIWSTELLGDAHPIAIHPGAGAAIKLWRVDGWVTVADTLSRATGSKIILTGTQAEYPLCAEIAEKMEAEASVLAGKTALDQLAAVLSQCRLVLGLDSGPMHLAVATGTPTVHLYGPVNAETFGPWGSRNRHRVVVSAWPCIPCDRLDYGPNELANHPCVREISADAVLAAAQQALAAGPQIE